MWQVALSGPKWQEFSCPVAVCVRPLAIFNLICTGKNSGKADSGEEIDIPGKELSGLG